MYDPSVVKRPSLIGPPVYRGGANNASVTQRRGGTAPPVYRPVNAVPNLPAVPRTPVAFVAQRKSGTTPADRRVAPSNRGNLPAQVSLQRASAPARYMAPRQQPTVQRSLRIESYFWHPHFRPRVQEALTALAGGAAQLVFDGEHVRMQHGAPQAASPSRELLARIINSPRTVSIRRTDGHNRCEPVGANAQQAMQAAANGVGTDAIVHINQPTMSAGAANTNVTVADPVTGAAVLAASPASILLGHELIHADRCIRGISSFSQQPVRGGGTTWTDTLGSFTRPNGMPGALGEEEIYTVGLPVAGGTAPNPDPHAVTENALRAEHQQPLRIAYP